jgi:hypothetical protein
MCEAVHDTVQRIAVLTQVEESNSVQVNIHWVTHSTNLGDYLDETLKQ